MGGDRPLVLTLSTGATVAPPRGGIDRQKVSLMPPCDRLPRVGGIDLSCTRSVTRTSWLPRVGGDRPPTGWHLHGGPWAPRVGGDRPVEHGMDARRFAAPPRGRG